MDEKGLNKAWAGLGGGVGQMLACRRNGVEINRKCDGGTRTVIHYVAAVEEEHDTRMRGTEGEGR